MRDHKLLKRLLCAFLSVLMLVCMAPAVLAATAEEIADTVGDGTGNDTGVVDPAVPGTTADLEEPSTHVFGSAMERLDYMTKYYDNGEYSLYCDPNTAIVAYRKNATNEVLFTTPWDMYKETSKLDDVRNEMMSQIILTYKDSQNNIKTLDSYTDAVKKKQYSISPIRNGVRVEYALGEVSARILVPMMVEANSFEYYVLLPMQDVLTGEGSTKEDRRIWATFNAYFTKKKYLTETNEAKKEAVARTYPICAEKNIDIYVFNSTPTVKELRKLENWILQYCPGYNFEMMDEQYDYVNYQEEVTSPPVFRVALEFTVGKNGLSVNVPGNGLRYDESAYRVTDLQILPFMGASYKGNVKTDAAGESYEGYSFIPDGSGALYNLTTAVSTGYRVYGEDYALFGKISGLHNEVMRMPVFGQVLTHTATNGKKTSTGYLAIIEEGASLATITPVHGTKFFSTIIPSFITRQIDTSKSGWDVYACRRYTDDYKLNYIILSDDTKAADAKLANYYECSWMGMACAYRDYLDANVTGYDRLTASDVKNSIPLYIETFGCVDTIEKVMSIPVTVSVALTSFKDVEEMYNYLSGENVTNINFKLTGYANGGMYSDVPYKLKWEKSVGGKSDFKELLETAKREGFGLYPDFDFVYTTQSDGGSHVKLKKHASRTIDNRYTTKRVYSATQQVLVSYFQMVMSPATYSHFYEKLAKRYDKYDATGISLSTFGNSLNSDYDEDDEKTVLREEALQLTMDALAYFKEKDYDVMVEGGNAFTWGYADHILDVPLDSSRYAAEMRSIPFMGVVLHGYVQFTGTALNLEGNLKYAMLKAMENGAAIYFVLSYTNTELLKEDFLLSQNYSVRYDIWKTRLVEIYTELNEVLADVQDKLIIGHEDLVASRVPDSDELLQDIIDEAKQQAALIAAKIERQNQAVSTIDQVLVRMQSNTNNFAQLYATLTSQLCENSDLLAAWDVVTTELAAGSVANASLMALNVALTTYIIEPYAKIEVMQKEMENLLASAKREYIHLLNAGTEADVIAAARSKVATVVDLYIEILQKYYGSDRVYHVTDALKNSFIDDTTKVTANDLKELLKDYDNTDVVIPTDKDNFAVLEAFIKGTTVYVDISVKDVIDSYKAYLNATVNVGSKILDFESLVAIVNNSLRVNVDLPAATVGNSVVADGTTGTSKYTTDNAVVKVTYGIDSKTPYKSLLLNFNDYSVQTVVDGVTYTIESYGYVVIMHGN